MTTETQKIPTGYKQTEIGIIPEDWDVKNLGDIGEIKMCRRIFNHETQEVGAIPFYKIGTFGKEADAYIPQELYDNYRRKFSFPKKGDVLISAAGTIGRTIVYDGEPAYFQDSNIVWIDNNEKLTSNDYLLYVFKIVKYNTEGGTIQRLYNNIIKSAKFVCPPKPQQDVICSVLVDTDKLIKKLEKLIEKKNNIKQGTMQELLTGKRRLSGFSGEWKTGKLGDFFLLSATYSKTKFIKEGGNFLIMDMGSVSSVGKLIASKSTYSKTDLLNIGDLVMPKDDIGGGNIIGKVAYIEQDNKYILGDHVYRLTAKVSDISALFFSYLINSDVVNSGLKKKVSGSAQLGLGRKSVEDQDVKIPQDKKEQTAIANVLSDMDTEIEKLESRLAKYQNIKQGMMQTLLTGKIRLTK